MLEFIQNNQYAEVSIVVVVIYSLLKVIGLLISTVVSERSMLTHSEQVQLEEMHKLITAKDTDGIPLFYVPRSWANLQSTILDKMEKITRHQERMTYTMDSLVCTMDKILERDRK